MERISDMNCPFLTESQIAGLKAIGIEFLMDIVSAPKELLESTLDFEDSKPEVNGYAELAALPDNFSPDCYSREFETGLYWNSRVREDTFRKLDEILDGGLRTGDILEFYGGIGCGKTQIALYLTSQFCHHAENPSTVLYFDLKNDFNASRLLQLCGGSDKNFDNVRVFRLSSFDELLATFNKIDEDSVVGINGLYSRCKLIVIDSVPMCIYPAIDPDDKYSWRYHQEKLLVMLRKLADTLKLSVVLLNHAVTSPQSSDNNSLLETGTSGSARLASTDRIKPALGHFWRRKVTPRIHLIQTARNRYKGILVKSSEGPTGQKFEFSIRDDKIENIAPKPPVVNDAATTVSASQVSGNDSQQDMTPSTCDSLVPISLSI